MLCNGCVQEDTPGVTAGAAVPFQARCAMNLDLTSVHKALASLGRAIARAKEAPDDEELRDAVIQRFEFTFELAWKTLKRQLEQEVAEPASVDRLAFHDLLREAAERGLLTDVEAWMEYRRQRNITAHTYDEAKAKSVYETALRFFPDAQALVETIGGRNRA
jgi:nucleotidyltransferase substrate binding protein (TIGR01987 family)